MQMPSHALVAWLPYPREPRPVRSGCCAKPSFPSSLVPPSNRLHHNEQIQPSSSRYQRTVSGLIVCSLLIFHIKTRKESRSHWPYETDDQREVWHAEEGVGQWAQRIDSNSPTQTPDFLIPIAGAAPPGAPFSAISRPRGLKLGPDPLDPHFGDPRGKAIGALATDLHLQPDLPERGTLSLTSSHSLPRQYVTRVSPAVPAHQNRWGSALIHVAGTPPVPP